VGGLEFLGAFQIGDGAAYLAGGQAFDVLTCIKRSPSRVIRCQMVAVSYQPSTFSS